MANTYQIQCLCSNAFLWLASKDGSFLLENIITRSATSFFDLVYVFTNECLQPFSGRVRDTFDSKYLPHDSIMGIEASFRSDIV